MWERGRVAEGGESRGLRLYLSSKGGGFEQEGTLSITAAPRYYLVYTEFTSCAAPSLWKGHENTTYLLGLL